MFHVKHLKINVRKVLYILYTTTYDVSRETFSFALLPKTCSLCYTIVRVNYVTVNG